MEGSDMSSNSVSSIWGQLQLHVNGTIANALQYTHHHSAKSLLTLAFADICTSG